MPHYWNYARPLGSQGKETALLFTLFKCFLVCLLLALVNVVNAICAAVPLFLQRQGVCDRPANLGIRTFLLLRYKGMGREFVIFRRNCALSSS